MKKKLLTIVAFLALASARADEVKFQPTTYSPPASLTIQTGVPLLGTWDFSGATVTGLPATGGGGTPGGANTQVQFNDAGAFGGSTKFTFNKTSGLTQINGDLYVGQAVTGPYKDLYAQYILVSGAFQGAGAVPTGGAAGQVLAKTDASDYDVHWITPASGGTPGGATTQVQFNNAGAFAGDAGFTYPGVTSTGANLFLQATGGQQWQIIAGGAAGLAGYYPANSFLLYNGANTNTPLLITSGQIIVPVDYMIGWQPSRGQYPDTGFSRNAAGIIEVNNGNVGQFADLKAKNIIATGAHTGNGSVPAGGGTSQVLTKNTATDYDVSWKTRLATKIIWITTAGSGTFTPDAGVKALYVEVMGGGGGSAGALGTASSSGSSGGGAGGSLGVKYYATPAASYPYVIGAGGTAGAATPTAGGKGGDTTFGTTSPLTGSGGNGSGIPAVSTNPGLSGAGGFAQGDISTCNCDAVMIGGAGSKGWRFVATSAYGGDGGTSVWAGMAPAAATINFAGASGFLYGGGAGGAASSNATGQVGAAGAGGAIKITESF